MRHLLRGVGGEPARRVVYTANGAVAAEGTTAAGDWLVITEGAGLEIEGVGFRLMQDRVPQSTADWHCGRIIDLYFDTHEEAEAFCAPHYSERIREVWMITPTGSVPQDR